MTRRTSGNIRTKIASRILHAQAPTDGPLPRGRLLRPHVTGHRYGMSHYNVVIPDLPDPHKFLACAVLTGRSGTRAFDIDHIDTDSPRHSATLAVGTAATAPSWFCTYDTRTDCDLHEDGSLMRFGDDLEIAGEFPDYRIRVRRPGLALDITAQCTEQITWFSRSPLYDHIGFPARYRGTLTWEGRTTTIEGILSLEHARGMSPVALRDRPVPWKLKLPWDFFTYQVLKVDRNTLLMLASIDMFGAPAHTAAYIKEIDGDGSRHVRDVEFDVLSHRDEGQVAPDGATMRLPHELRWRIIEEGRVTTEIRGTTDTEFIYGLGRGWIGGYTYAGHHQGRPVAGNAYLEYVDLAKPR